MASIVPIIAAQRLASAQASRSRKLRRYSFDSSGRCLGYDDVSASKVYWRRGLTALAIFTVVGFLVYAGISSLRDNNQIQKHQAPALPSLSAPL